MGGQVGLERISGLVGKARLNDHLHIPKSERKSNNTEKKDGSQIPRRKKSGSENQGVTVLYGFINSEILSGHYPTYITSLHQIWAHFIQPISLYNSPKFLSRGKHCEGSTIFIYPNGMKFLQILAIPK